MLVLKRKVGEWVTVRVPCADAPGGERVVRVGVVSTYGDHSARIGFEADQDVAIERLEIAGRKRRRPA